MGKALLGRAGERRIEQSRLRLSKLIIARAFQTSRNGPLDCDNSQSASAAVM